MQTVEKSGKTVDEAIAAALDELKLPLADVKVEILDEGSRDESEAKVRVSQKVKSEIGVKSAALLKELLAKMGMASEVVVHEEGNTMRLEIHNNHDSAILIGFRGKTLNSLQYLVSQMLWKNISDGEQRYDIEVDLQEYRARRRKLLTRMAEEAIGKVDLIGKPIDLEPMSAYDRKFIHMIVQKEEGFTSNSVGEGQDRHIVIAKGNYEFEEQPVDSE